MPLFVLKVQFWFETLSTRRSAFCPRQVGWLEATTTKLWCTWNSFYLNPNTGFVVTAGASEVMRITPAGDVGIGVDSPASKLHVNGKIRANDYDLEALPPLSTAP